MAIEARELVERVMEHLGVQGQPQAFADRMGWKRGTERLIARWLNGEVQPGYGYTIEMLAAAGWFDVSSDAAAEPGSGEIQRTPQTEMALLTQIVTLLEEDPSAASGELAPALEVLASQLAELSNRLRRAGGQQGERWHRG